MTLGDKLDKEEGSKLYYSSVSQHGVQYKVGDSVFLMPDAFNFSIKPAPPKKQKADKRDVSFSMFFT